MQSASDMQAEIRTLRTRLEDSKARLRRAPIPAELKRLVTADVDRIMRDPNLRSGTRAHTVRGLQLQWHPGELIQR